MKLGPVPGMGAMYHHAPLNPVLSLPSIVNYTDFTDASKYNFSSGVLAASIARVTGSAADFAQSDSGLQPDYDAAAFSGKGGLVISALTDFMKYGFGSGLTAQTLGVVLEVPAHVSNRELLAFGNSTTGFSTAKIFHTGANRLSYNRRNPDNAAVELINIDGDGGVFIIVLRYNSASSMDAYNNSLTPINLDPDNNATTLTYLYIGDNDAAVPNAKFAEFFHCSAALSDTEIAGVINHWAAKYGVALL